jgi:hypothetical protein
MTTAIVNPHRSWMPAVNLFAATAAIALSVTALVVAADGPEATPAAPAPVAAVAAPLGASADELCDQRVGTVRC